jgi:hypothetical protein
VTASRGRRGGRTSRAAVAVVLALLGLSALSGCSSHLTPGVAATIDGDSISQGRVDSIVKAACAYTAASASDSQAPPRVSLANLRSAITGALVQFAVIDRAASDMKVSVDQATIAQAASQNTIPPGLKPVDRDALKGFFYDLGKSTEQTQVIGAHLSDPTITSSRQVHGDTSKQANKYLATYATKQEVRVNPAYGTWNGKSVVGGSGSLSDPVSDLAKASETAASNSQANTSSLPSSQVC